MSWCISPSAAEVAPGECCEILTPVGVRLRRFSAMPCQPYSIKKAGPANNGRLLFEFENVSDKPWQPLLQLLVEEGTGTPFDWPLLLHIKAGKNCDAQWFSTEVPFLLERIHVHIPSRLPQDTLRLTSVKCSDEEQLANRDVPAHLFTGSVDHPLALPGAQQIRLAFRNAGDVDLEALVWLEGRVPRS